MTAAAAPLIVLGVDPSSYGLAGAVIRASRRPDGTWLYTHLATSTTGRLESYTAIQSAFADLLEEWKPDLVGIEVPGAFAGDRSHFAHLIGMCLGVGVMVGLKADVVLVPANGRGASTRGGWRPYLFGRGRLPKGQSWDRAVSELLETGVVTDWPRRSNGHVRDAAMVALALHRAHTAGDLGLIGGHTGFYAPALAVEENAVRAREAKARRSTARTVRPTGRKPRTRKNG